MSTEQTVTPFTDKESIENLNDMEFQNRILKLRAALKLCGINAEHAITKRPDNVSEVAWMASHLGDIFRYSQQVLSDDLGIVNEAVLEEESNG